MLVFSHEYGGSGLGAVFFTEAIATRGWIVAYPDPHDKHSAVRIPTGHEKDFDRLGLLQHAKEIAASGPGDHGNYLYRLDEMGFALEGVTASEPFGKLIARDRIVVGGHSFGGYTALGLSGDIKERRDPRIKAILLFSTGAGVSLYSGGELKEVRIPSMLFMGERAENQRRDSEIMAELSAKIYRNVSSPKYFLEIKRDNHFSFNNRFSHSRISELLSGMEEKFEVIRPYSIVFLGKHLAGREDSDRVLERRDPLLTRYDTEPVPHASRHAWEAPDARTRRAEPGAPADVDKPLR